jgi:hypothetical protein
MKADSEVKRLALKRAYVEFVAGNITTWSAYEDLLIWLQN